MSSATDSVIATIASILDRPQPASSPADVTQPVETRAAEQPTVTAVPVEPEGYTKAGPGPMAALRFKWTVRRGDDGYYVDETMGTSPSPVIAGPFEGDAAIKFVDGRANGAKAYFEALKSEMTGAGPAAPMLAWGVGR